MTTWMWIILGIALFLGLSAVVGLAVAAILGSIARDVAEVLESEAWASAPLTRTSRLDAATGEAPATRFRTRARR